MTLPCLTSTPWHLQEKQIRGKHAVKQLRDRMKANQLQVADRVRKHVASARLLPKVVSASCLQPCALRNSSHMWRLHGCLLKSGECPLAAALHGYAGELALRPCRLCPKHEYTSARALLRACVHHSSDLTCNIWRGSSKLAMKLAQLVDTFSSALT